MMNRSMRVICAVLATNVIGVSAQASATTLSSLVNQTVAQARGVALIPDQYIITLNKAPAGGAYAGLDVAAQAQQLLATVGGGDILWVYEYALRGFSVRISALQAELLRSNPLVARVEQDSEVRAIATQSNPPSYGLDRVDQRNRPLDARYVYPDQGGQGVHVYILDTGLNASHSDFSGRVGSGRNFASHSSLPVGGSVNASDTSDCNGHGTHVAGTAAGTSFGVAKKTTVHPVRVLDCAGSGSNAAVIGGIDWVTANALRPAVANMSLGGGNNTSLDTAVRNSINSGIAYAVAAGNDNVDACTGSPNRVAEALTVGSTTSTDARSSFSNFGSCVDLFAPGSNIVSANYSNNTGSSTLSGTSMAAPHVAGAAALVLARNAGQTPVQIASVLLGESTSGVLTGIGTGSPNKLLYVASSGGTPVDNPPQASFTFSCSNLACNFTSTSTDDNGIAASNWNFGDSSSGSGATVSKTYAAAGSYSVTLTVTDTASQAGSSTQTVSVTAASSGPCSDCSQVSGTLASGGTAYSPSSAGAARNAGQHKGYLRGPAGTDFDLYLEKASTGLLGTSWSIVARAENATSSEDIVYTGTAGTYRWRIKSYSGAGSYDFYFKNP